jgi:biopolymer transport protein ExbD
MRRKLLHWVVIVVFLAVLMIRMEQHFRSPHSTGFLLGVGNSVPAEGCELIAPLVLHISANRELRLNSEPETRDQLSSRLAVILRERVRPVLYVLADGDMSIQEFAEYLEIARKSNDKVQVRLVTPGNRKYSCVDYQYGLGA